MNIATKMMKIKMRQLLIQTHSKLCNALRWKTNLQFIVVCMVHGYNTRHCDVTPKRYVFFSSTHSFVAIEKGDYIVHCLHFNSLPYSSPGWANDENRNEHGKYARRCINLIRSFDFMKTVVYTSPCRMQMVIRMQMITSRGLNWVRIICSFGVCTNKTKRFS